MNSEMSEKRSMTESQNPPKGEVNWRFSATLPSMKSKMLAATIRKPAGRNRPSANIQAAAMLIRTPVSVSALGWIRSATASLMMMRSGTRQMTPMARVKVIFDSRARAI